MYDLCEQPGLKLLVLILERGGGGGGFRTNRNKLPSLFICEY